MVEKLLTIEEVADIARVNRETVYRWCRNGELRAIKMGAQWRIRESALRTFMDTEVHATEAATH